MNEPSRKSVLILGSTGSIGTSTLDILQNHLEEFSVFGLVAGRRGKELVDQCQRFQPQYALLTQEDPSHFEFPVSTTVLSGEGDLHTLVTHPDVDVVVAAMVGIAGLAPVYHALCAGKTVLLANKESLVCGGALLMDAAKRHHATLISIDSEHSALLQLMGSERRKDLSRLILTASGGPFYFTPKEQFGSITVAEAVRHPRWSMGKKISIDSATMVNKALEVIEAHWLFGMDPDLISVIVHPESIIHSLIEFHDGTQFAHLSVADMKGPIAYALRYPKERFPNVMKPLDLASLKQLSFFEMDDMKFPAIQMAREALKQGKGAPAVFNCANEEAVELFSREKIRFLDILLRIEGALAKFSGVDYTSLEDLGALDQEVRNWVRQ